MAESQKLATPAEQTGPEQPAAVDSSAHAERRRWLAILLTAGVSIAAVAQIGQVLGGLSGFYATYKVALEFIRPDKATDRAATASSQTSTAQKLSIAILPFTNLTGDPQQDYFVDGITEGLITDLSRGFPGSFVIPSTTMFTYKGKAINAKQIGQELGVRYLLEGSVTSSNNRLRLRAQLIDAQSQANLWAERFDKDRSEVLQMQDEIVFRLVRAVGLRVIDEEARRSVNERVGNPTAIDLVMRGHSIRGGRSSSRQNMQEARALFEKALEHDPKNVDALQGLARTYVTDVANGYYADGRAERLRLAAQALDQALALDPNHVGVLYTRCILRRVQEQFQEAIEVCKIAIENNPAEPQLYKEIAFDKIYLGQAEQAFEWLDQAELIGPRDPARWTWYSGRSQALFLLGRDREAIASLRKTIEVNPDYGIAYAYLAAAHALLGETAEARSALAESQRRNPSLTSIEKVFATRPSPNAAYLAQAERFREGLQKAGLPEK